MTARCERVSDPHVASLSLAYWFFRFAKGYSPSGNISFPLVPATVGSQQRNGPLDYGVADSSQPSSASAPSPPSNYSTKSQGPSTMDLNSYRSLPLPPTASITGPKAPPLYSTTGFDMLGILARVASRPNPTIVLGPVDLSCSFVVVDVQRYDHPIIYASPTFVSVRQGFSAAQLSLLIRGNSSS